MKVHNLRIYNSLHVYRSIWQYDDYYVSRACSYRSTCARCICNNCAVITSLPAYLSFALLFLFLQDISFLSLRIFFGANHSTVACDRCTFYELESFVGKTRFSLTSRFIVRIFFLTKRELYVTFAKVR